MRLTQTRIPLWDLEAATKRILFFYNLLARRPPLVVLEVYDRMEKGPYAEVLKKSRTAESIY